MSLPPLAVTILQADVADVPRLSAIAQAAFETDTHTRMKMLERDTTDMASELQDFAAYFAPGAAEKSIIIKAVDTATGEMVGFAGFSRWNYDGSHPALPAGEEDPRVTNPTKGMEPVTADDLPVEHMAYATSVAHRKMWTRVMPLGERTLYYFGISVTPECQGRGVGSALVRWVSARADADGVGVGVTSSQDGWHVFARNGFDVADTFTVDLDKYATKPRIVDGKEAKWGEYTFRLLLRKPIKGT